MAARRTLGSLVPHPAQIGKIMGAKLGIGSARAPHLAGGGIANAENMTSSMFQPIGGSTVPDADVSFITSPNLAIGHGAPNPPSSQSKQQPSTMQDIAAGTSAANGLTGLYNKIMPSGGGISGLIPSSLNPATAAQNSALASVVDNDAGSSELSSIIGANGAGADAIAEDAGSAAAGSGILDSIGSTVMQALPFLASIFADGGAVPMRAGGGDVPGVESMNNMLMRREQGETYHPGGFLNNAGPGRTDTINTNVPAGAYVIPADIVSGIGEGNSLAGSAIIDRMFSSSPYGVAKPKIGHGEGAPRARADSHPESPPTGVQSGPTVNTAAINSAGSFAKGGAPAEKAPVVVAGGEHVLSPQAIISKFGSLKKGHALLDHWVVGMRQKIAKEMLALPNPVGSRVKK